MARTDTLGNFLTDVAIAIRNKKGTTDTIVASNFDTEIESIETGGGTTEPIFTGHYDTEGLRQIGWTDEEIEYYNQNGVQWNSSEDNYFKLTQTELAGDDSKNTRFLPKSSTKTSFASYYKLLAIPQLNTSSVTTMESMFSNCYSLTMIPQLNTGNITNMNNMFNGCSSLTTIPQLNTGNITNMHNMFYNCYSLKTIPQLDTNNVTNMNNMFYDCYSLKTIPQLDTNNVTNMNNMFYHCHSLTMIPQLNTGNVTNMNNMFASCSSLETVPQLNTSNVTSVASMFASCSSLETVPQLDTSNVTSIVNMFINCSSLKTLGGLLNLGQAYKTTTSANNSSYKLDLSGSPKLTEQSLINILNNLYDIKTKGCKAQQVALGSTNLAKLTSEEGQSALAQATAKGWTVS